LLPKVIEKWYHIPPCGTSPAKWLHYEFDGKNHHYIASCFATANGAPAFACDKFVRGQSIDVGRAAIILKF